MRTLSDTIRRITAFHDAAARINSTDGRLHPLPNFGSNPGALNGWIYIPPGLSAGAALVVVLHGCTQTAAGYDIGSGWSEMADKHGFALLFPEQQRRNNPNLCFNWFLPDDSRRGSGEASSIRQMIEAVAHSHPIDPARTFITGLSAGGAMTSVMLATYPEVFAGGAIIAGLPYGCAASIPQAFDRMRGHGMPGDAELSALVRSASAHAGPWPTLSVWHGSGDAIVNPANADTIIAQWRTLHGVNISPTRIDAIDGYPRRVWCTTAGREVIEEYSITGMGHGAPLDTSGANGCGKAGAYMLQARISSTRHICRFWGLVDDRYDDCDHRSVMDQSTAPSLLSAERVMAGTDPQSANPRLKRPFDMWAARGHASKVIEDALRAAGLMR